MYHQPQHTTHWSSVRPVQHVGPVEGCGECRQEHSPCEGIGWVDDPTACGDPDHCSPMHVCECNPEGEGEHQCGEECHPTPAAADLR